MKTAFSVLLIAILFTGCSTGGDSSSEGDPILMLNEPGNPIPLKDDPRLLGGIRGVVPVGEKELLIADDTPGLALFRDYEMVSNIGSEGEGPCEYTAISAADVKGDSLFVMNFRQARIITFDLRTGECLGETSHSSLSMPGLMARGNGQFILGRTTFTMATPDSATLLFALSDEGERTPLPLQLGSIDPVQTKVPMTMSSLNFARSGDLLFSYFPMTDVMNVLNLQTDEIEQFPLQIDVQREEIEQAVENPQRVLEILNGSFPMVISILATDQWLAVNLTRQNGDAESVNLIQFYSPDGTFRGEVEMDRRPVAAQGDQLIFMQEATDSGDYAYEVYYRSVVPQEESP